jgi:hypothetical protein
MMYRMFGFLLACEPLSVVAVPLVEGAGPLSEPQPAATRLETMARPSSDFLKRIGGDVYVERMFSFLFVGGHPRATTRHEERRKGDVGMTLAGIWK